MEEECDRKEQLTSWRPGSKERGIQEEARERYSPKDMPPVTNFLQLSTISCLSVSSSNVTVLGMHHRISPFIRSESSSSNHL
jgi:hypothetical protein